MIYLNTIAYFLFIGMIGYYTITNLQWYSYRLKRVIFHHTKIWWHFVYFLIPFVTYELISALTHLKYGFGVVLLYTPLFIWWIKGLDKKLVVTSRVKRFFVALFIFAIFISFGVKGIFCASNFAKSSIVFTKSSKFLPAKCILLT